MFRTSIYNLPSVGDPSVDQFIRWSGFNTSIVGFGSLDAVYVWLRSLECLVDLRPRGLGRLFVFFHRSTARTQSLNPKAKTNAPKSKLQNLKALQPEALIA